MAVAMLEGTAHLFCDCANVVRSWSLGALSAKDHKATYSGLIQEARQSTLSDFVDGVTWVKAHQSLSAVLKSGDRGKIQLARGNDAADTAANKGRLLHAQPNQADADRVKWQCAHAAAAAKVMAAVLPMWPRLEHLKERTKADASRGWAAEAPLPTERHRWTRGRKKWHCSQCHHVALGALPNTLRSHQRCKGLDVCLAERTKEFGHDLWTANCGGTPVIVCATCGAWMDQSQETLQEEKRRGGSACQQPLLQSMGSPQRQIAVGRATQKVFLR